MADVNVDEMTEEQIDEMGNEDAERVVVDEESGVATLKDPPPVEKDEITTESDEKDDKDEKPPAEGDDKDKKPEEDDKPKDEAATVDDDIAKLEEVPKEERTEAQVMALRHLNAEKRMHSATKEAAELKKENARLAEELYNKELAAEDPEPERMSQEELDELPPDEKAAQIAEEKAWDDRQEARAAQQSTTSFKNLAAFFKTLKNSEVSVDDLIKLEADPDSRTGYKYSNTEFGEWITSDEFKALDKEVTAMKKNYDGTYSVEQIQKAYFTVNKDKLLSDAQRTGREQALNDIDSANHSDASKLDGIPKTEGKRGLKKVSDLTQDEIDNMSDEEEASYIKNMEQEGLA
jgi:hypothetical protein